MEVQDTIIEGSIKASTDLSVGYTSNHEVLVGKDPVVILYPSTVDNNGYLSPCMPILQAQASVVGGVPFFKGGSNAAGHVALNQPNPQP